MISELVVVASTLLLSAGAQQQPYQIVHLQNHPINPLKDQLFMLNSANTLLNQDIGTPIQPGLLSSFPVLVNQATQSILDQESKVVGYNLPNQVFQVPNYQSYPKPIPVTAQDAVQRVKYGKNQNAPQSLTFPLVGRQPDVIPVRAMTSIKDFFQPEKKRHNPYVNYKSNLFHSVKQQLSQHPNFKTRNPHANLYDDIPRNHPVPPPLPQTTQKPVTLKPRVIYYDISPNHPVPPPPSKQPNSFDQIKFEYLQPTKGTPQNQVQYEIAPALETRPDADYAPARPPMPFSPEEQARYKPSEERNRFQESRDESFLVPPPPPRKEIEIPEINLMPPENNFVPSTKKADSKKGQKKSQTTTESSVATTYRPSVDDDVEDDVDLPSKSKGKKKRKDNSDLDGDHSENYYQQAPSYDNNYSSGYSSSSGGGYSGGYPGGYSQPEVHKHIFVHSAPEEPYQAPRVRVVRPPVKAEKHVNIIFVKSPSPPPETQTVVELPPPEQPKTFVYVLSKKPQETGSNVKFVSPPQTKPKPPEIFFIRYGTQDQGYGKGYPVPNLQSLYEQNGALAQPQPLGEIEYNQQQPQSPQPPPQIDFRRPEPLGEADLQLPLPPPPSSDEGGEAASSEEEPRGVMVPPAPHPAFPAFPARSTRPFRSPLMMLRHKRDKDYGLSVYAPLMAYTSSGQINEITAEEAAMRRIRLEDFF